jgi:membrane protein required for colicin V production
MNTLDIIFLITISLTTFYGVWKGLVKQVLSIVGIVAGYIVATQYYADLAAHMKLSDPTVSKIVSFVILFLACVVLFSILAVALNKVFRLPGLGMINTFFGGVIGFIKGFVLIALTLVILIVFLSAENPLLKKSLTAPYILKGLLFAENIIPKDIKTQYTNKIEGLIRGTHSEPAGKK